LVVASGDKIVPFDEFGERGVIGGADDMHTCARRL
jgi:hypothetical protein